MPEAPAGTRARKASKSNRLIPESTTAPSSYWTSQGPAWPTPPHSRGRAPGAPIRRSGGSVANRFASRCSRMLVMELVRLRWALGGENPSFDPIPWSEIGRRGHGPRGDTVWSCPWWRGENPQWGRLERVELTPGRWAAEASVMAQGPEGKPGRLGTRWRKPPRLLIAQACNCSR